MLYLNYMKIYTSYFAKLNKILDAGYFPISIARYTPKGLNIAEIKTFAPSEDLLRKIKSGEIDETEYEKIYRKDMERFDFNRVWKTFEQISEINGKKDLVLLCFEKSGDFCHRHIFASIMGEKTKNKIKELNI